MKLCSGILCLMIVVTGMSCPALAQQITRIKASQAQIELKREVPISTEVAGRIVSVSPSTEGKHVKAGDVLIQLDDSVIQAEVRRAQLEFEQQTEIEFARASLEVAKAQQAQKVTANERRPGSFTPAELRTANLEVTKAEASLNKALGDKLLQEADVAIKRAQLAQYTVRAPFDGMASELIRYPGNNVRQGDPVMTLTDMSEMRAVVRVPYKERDKLFVGDQVEIIIQEDAAEPADDFNPSPEKKSDPFSDQCSEPGTNASEPSAEPAVEPVDEDREGVFIGEIMQIDPSVQVITKVRYVELIVYVKNRMDKHDRYMLQKGVPVDAYILSKERD
jgi:multidrug efflux pump subunit AcrA (membrane-fusion protein)